MSSKRQGSLPSLNARRKDQNAADLLHPGRKEVVGGRDQKAGCPGVSVHRQAVALQVWCDQPSSTAGQHQLLGLQSLCLWQTVSPASHSFGEQ